MRAVLQRATTASVSVDDEIVGAIDRPGLVALVGATHDDGAAQVSAMARKISELRILRDERSVLDEAAPHLDEPADQGLHRRLVRRREVPLHVETADGLTERRVDERDPTLPPGALLGDAGEGAPDEVGLLGGQRPRRPHRVLRRHW